MKTKTKTKITSAILMAAILVNLTACDSCDSCDNATLDPPSSDILGNPTEGSSDGTPTGSTNSNDPNDPTDLPTNLPTDGTTQAPPPTVDGTVPTHWQLETPPEEIEFTQTLAHEALAILKRDTFALEANLAGFGMNLYKRGDDLHAIFAGMVPYYIIDGKHYRINHSTKSVYYRPATLKDREEILGHFDEFDTLADLDGYTLVETGVERFRNFNALYYEKYENSDGDMKQLLFHHRFNNELYGLITQTAEQEYPRNFIYHVSATLPEQAFVFPAGFEPRPEP